MLVIALTGVSGVGKSHIAELLARDFQFTHLRFSDKLKEMYPDDGSWVNNFDSYKHYLCQKAERVNIVDPNLFIFHTLHSVGIAQDGESNVVIDDLRTPRQLSSLYSYCERKGIELVVVRVKSDQGKVVSFMDRFVIPAQHTIQNDNLSDAELITHISQAIQKSTGGYENG